ncbi:hypothetical protein V2J09_006969 [Rumex salicifolius]
MLDQTAASLSRPSTKLRDILMSDKPTLSYADFHHQITRNTDGYLAKSYGGRQSHGTEVNAEKDELVRYMSNLPSYLEKGKNFQEKPLNVGVLDWRRLEKWNYGSDQVFHKNSGYSSSTSSASYFSTEGSSSQSSRGQISFPDQQRVYCSSLQSQLEAPPMKKVSQDECYPGKVHNRSPSHQRTYHLVPHSHHQKVYPLEGCSHSVDLIEGVSASIHSHRIREQNLFGKDQSCTVKESGVNLEMHKKKECESNAISDTGKQQSWGNSDVISSRKGKLKIRESELKEAMQSRTLGDYHPDCSKERNTVVLLVPRDLPKNKGTVNSSDLKESAIRFPKECRGKSFSEQANLKEAHNSVLSLNVPHTCPLPSQENIKKKSEMRESRSTNTRPVNMSSQLKSPSRIRRNVEEKPSIVVLKSSIVAHMSGELDSNTGSQPTMKVRHPSPIRRLGSAMGNIVRSSGSRDNTPLRRSSSKDSVAKPSLDRAADSVSLNADKSLANGRARSSPLRRLLDPLIKPKATNVCELAEPLRKDEHSSIPKPESVNVKSTFISSKSKGAKKDSSSLQALLQVGVNNGLPVFTFAVENDSDNILAATVRKCSAAEKNRSKWIYTFLSLREMKKKSGLWPNHGCKGKGQYLPNVIAQMTVSDHQAPAITRQNCTDGDTTREFTLFSVDVGQADQNATEFQPTNELAAIVVKLLKANAGSPSEMSIQDRHSIRSQIPLSTTVILPGGVHTIPSKGSISTLTERWRSGGSCDCGGWDLGCQLRIFTNQGDSLKFLTSSKAANISDEFKLYHQVGQETELVLRVNPFKDRIYSVEFNSSISLLQAFATCVAVLDCKILSGLSITSNGNEGRSSSASYVSYPPHSPVGRA